MASGAIDPTGVAKVNVDEVTIPATDVSVYEALYGRRMAWRYKDEPVPKEALSRMLDTAVWAPNHRLTEPWRFFILEKGSEARKKVAGLAYEFSMGRNDNPTRAEASRQTILDPPIVMFVYSVPGPNEDTTQENYASVCCAAQNISLAGFAEGREAEQLYRIVAKTARKMSAEGRAAAAALDLPAELGPALEV